MDDLDVVLDRLATSTRRHASESIDIEEALSATLARATDTTPTTDASSRRSARRWLLASAAGLVGLVAIGVWALVGGDRDERLVPVAPPASSTPAPTAPTPAQPISTESVPSTMDGAATAPTDAVVSTPSESSPAPAALSGPCRGDVPIEQAAAEFFEALLIARTIDDFAPVNGCLDAVPDTFDGEAPNCWATCAQATRTLLSDTYRTGEVFEPSGTVRQSSSVAVSYVAADGRFLDVVETWSLTPTADGFVVGDFRIEDSFIDREESAATIATYFDHIARGDWQAAAAMLDDGARSPEDRQDLARLGLTSFTTDAIAEALADWCRLGCDTVAPSLDELDFDGRNSIERDGQRVQASWFEGVYSISGLPIRTPDSLAADFDDAAILADGSVSEAEYRVMFAFLARCTADAGAPSAIPMPELDDLDRRFDYSIPGDSIEQFDACYDANGMAIDVTFQTDPARTAEREANYAVVARCLDAAGIDYRALAQQHFDDDPADFPITDVDELSIDALVDLARLGVFESNSSTAATYDACLSL